MPNQQRRRTVRRVNLSGNDGPQVIARLRGRLFLCFLYLACILYFLVFVATRKLYAGIT
jgi:hypothetical protein